MVLKEGTRIRSDKGTEITVEKLLGEGGQGHVYRVNYRGTTMALKIYKPGVIANPQFFFENLTRNAELSEPPSEAFVWPRDTVRLKNGARGYVMDFMTKPYVSFEKFLLPLGSGGVRFHSFKTIIDAMINLVCAFQKLHILGYSYQDLNDGNFFFNPATGDVKICDNDNVAYNKMNTGVIGKPRYIAPEVVLGKNMPDAQSDRFSLAVILFMMMTISHPLEGRRFLAELITPQMERRLYAEEPIFVMHPTDKRNGIDPSRPHLFSNLTFMWNWMPQELRNLFARAFSDEVLKDPSKRIREDVWLQTLLLVRNRFVTCPHCLKETVYQRKERMICEDCRKEIPLRFFVIEKTQKIHPISWNAQLCRGHIGYANQGKSGECMVRVARSRSSGRLFFTNVSGGPVHITLRDGRTETLQHAASCQADNVTALEIGQTMVTVKE